MTFNKEKMNKARTIINSALDHVGDELNMDLSIGSISYTDN